MSTALVLIGGRSAVPAISGILQFLDDISKIKFLVCKGEEYEKLQRTAYSFIKDKKESIDFVPDRDVKVVDPYNFTQVLKSLTELLAGEEEVSFAIGLTQLDDFSRAQPAKNHPETTKLISTA